MADERYTDSEAYQQELVAQYKERIPTFPTAKVVEVLEVLGFTGIAEDSVKVAEAGNVNATFLTPNLVVKINQNKKERDYYANKVVSDMVGEHTPIVKVLAYDFFEKTDCEVLVMERAPGKLLLDDLLKLSPEEQAVIFRQVFGVVNQLAEITFQDFGAVNADEHFPSYGDYLMHDFKRHITKIRAEKLCDEEDIKKVEEYFEKNVEVFASDTNPVFVHTDLHMHNILHEGDKVTAILDFDSALQAPKWVVLRSLLGLIAEPSQYVEGTKDFPKYKGKTFYHLLPVLQKAFPDVFSDPDLLRKLNVRNVAEAMKWIAENWSADWNKEMMRNTVERELASDEEALKSSYYGKVFSHIDR